MGDNVWIVNDENDVVSWGVPVVSFETCHSQWSREIYRRRGFGRGKLACGITDGADAKRFRPRRVDSQDAQRVQRPLAGHDEQQHQ